MTWDRYDDPPVHYWKCETCGDDKVLDALTHTCEIAEDVVLIHVEHAYHNRSVGSAHGADHWVVEHPLSEGRLHREPGDALCKPSHQFWGLYDERQSVGGATEADCARCIEIATRLGARLAAAAPPVAEGAGSPLD